MPRPPYLDRGALVGTLTSKELLNAVGPVPAAFLVHRSRSPPAGLTGPAEILDRLASALQVREHPLLDRLTDLTLGDRLGNVHASV